MAATDLTQVVSIDVDAALRATDRVGDGLADMIATIPNADGPTRKLKWTLGETAAHIVQTVRLHADCCRGDVSPRQFDIATFGRFLAEQNDERVREESERDSKLLADALRSAVRDFQTAATALSPTDKVMYPGGYSLEFPLTCATLLGELLVHGHDIARSIRAKWKISPDDARLVIYSIPAMLPLGVDPTGIKGVRGRAHVRVRGGDCFSIDVREESATGGRCDGKPDVTISAAPVPYLLASYGRISPIPPALTGQIVSWGRKPLFPLQLQRAFRNP